MTQEISKIVDIDNRLGRIIDCACGCNQKTTDRAPSGYFRRFIFGHQNRGSNSAYWKGGKYIDYNGYVMILIPKHHRSNHSFSNKTIIW